MGERLRPTIRPAKESCLWILGFQVTLRALCPDELNDGIADSIPPNSHQFVLVYSNVDQATLGPQQPEPAHVATAIVMVQISLSAV